MFKADSFNIHKKHLFLLSYFIMMLGLFCSVTDFIPLQSLFAKFKFIFIGAALIDILSGRGKLKKIDKNVLFIFIVLIINAVFFGFFAVNPIVADEISYQLYITSLFLLILFLTYYQLNVYNCYREFLKYSYYALTIVIILAFITHLNQVAWNPLFIMKSFFGIRARATLGLIHWNYVGVFCFSIFIISYFILFDIIKQNRVKEEKNFLIYMAFADVITFLTLNSASSRTPTISLMLFVFVIACYYIFMKLSKRSRSLLVLILVPCILFAVLILSVSGVFSYVWENSNRALNVSVNYPIFQELGNIWTGMGWVETGAFQSTAANNWVSAFGVKTSSLDMYYVYVFFSTGVIGCVLIGSVLLKMGYHLAKKSKDLYSFSYFALYVAILFYLFWATILFTAKFWQTMILLVMMLYQIGKKDEVEENVQ